MEKPQVKTMTQYLQQNYLRLSDDLTKANWLALGKQLFIAHQSTPWLIADWVTHGEKCDYMGEELYLELETIFSISRKTIQDYKSVAKALFCRKSQLSFSHHSVVMTLEPNEQESFLDEAIENKWNVAKLKTEVGEFKARRRVVDTTTAGEEYEDPGKVPTPSHEAMLNEHSSKVDDFWNNETFDIKCKGMSPLLHRVFNLAGPDATQDQLIREDVGLEIMLWLKEHVGINL